MCKFCETFDFSKAKVVINKFGASISLPLYTEFPIKEQFNFCPNCGKNLKENKEK